MATAPSVRELLEPNLSAMGKTLEQRIAEAQAKGDKKELARLNFAAGTQSALTGVATGLPDLAVAGFNWVTGGNTKDLRTRFLEASGVPTKATEAEFETLYNIPEYTAMAIGLGQLAKGGWKGYRAFKDNKKVAEFAKELEKSSGPQAANRFKAFMATGQGSDNPMVYAALDQMKKNPKYAELFTRLDKAAAEAAVKGMTPRPSKLTSDEAAKGIVKSVKDKLESVTKARNTAGDEQFAVARALAGDRKIVDTSETLAYIRGLRSKYGNVDTPEAKAVMSFVDRMEDMIAPRVTAPATAGTAVRGDVASAVRYDSLGMPIPASVARDVNIPGSAGYTTRQSPQNFSVDQLQQLLHEFGKKVGTDDSIIKGISQSDLEKINKGVFAALQRDLSSSVKLAGTTQDRQALGKLISARKQFADASGEYNRLIAQGMPKFLQDKSLDELSLEDLTKAYKGLNKGQRELFRGFVGTNKAEALQALDRQVFQDFLAKSYKELPDGTMGYDLGELARSWDILKKTDPNQADMLATSLGTNATEFSGRMKDALTFSRRMSIGKETEEASDVLDVVRREAPVAVGSIPAVGYSGAKVTQLTLDTLAAIMKEKKLTPDLIAKALLTPEGAAFLKSAALSPGSRETLESLTKMTSALPATKAYTALSSVVTGATPRGNEADEVAMPDDIFIPDDIMVDGVEQPQGGEDDVFIPADLMDDQLGMDTQSPESSLRNQVGPGGVVQQGNLNQLDPEVLARDPDPRVQGMLQQIGLIP